jgi:hypothetical protein
MTATDAAIREIKVLVETTSQTQAQKPTTVARSKDQGPRVENVNNCITIQDNEERMEGGRLWWSRPKQTCPSTHARGYTNRRW